MRRRLPPDRRRALDRLYATGLFSGVWLHAVEPGGGGVPPVLAVRAETPPRTLLSGAAGYGNDRGARVWGTVQRNQSLAGRPLLLSADLS